MNGFIKGMELCGGFFRDCAKPILDENFPELVYSAGLIGYGSDVLGYDDAVSADHMWGPRFYLFLTESDMGRREEIFRALSAHLPCTYRGYSVNFTEPDPDDNGVQHPAPITEGPVNPLIFIRTFPDFLTEQLGTADTDSLTPAQWLSFSEHRLLSIVSGRFFTDGLGCAAVTDRLRFYPTDVKLYLIASCWAAIASEQAFMKRCGMCGDDIGSRIITARIAERLMRLCFLYRDTYAPYSKWFGTAFGKLDVDPAIGRAVSAALSADSLTEREDALITAQALTADLHNASGVTEPVEYRIDSYFGRDIKVIFADRFADAASEKLAGTPLADTPLLGSFSQMGGLSDYSDDPQNYGEIRRFYGK